MKTDDLIRALAQDAAVRWRFGQVLCLALVGGAAIAGTAFFLSMGFRPDIAHALETLRFVGKVVLVLCLAIAATGMVKRMATPGAPAGPWAWALAGVPVLLGIAVLAELWVMPQASWSVRLVGHNARHCVLLIPLLAIGPLACLLLALRYAAPRRPGFAGAVAGLAATGIAATFYATNCADDSPLFVATWYPIATGIVVLVGYFAGARLAKW
jgi:hypothetical protein